MKEKTFNTIGKAVIVIRNFSGPVLLVGGLIKKSKAMTIVGGILTAMTTSSAALTECKMIDHVDDGLTFKVLGLDPEIWG